MKPVIKYAASALLCAALAGSGSTLYAQHDDHHDDHRGYVRHNEWRRGYHMRDEDWRRGRQVDWHAHHLRQPPRGYEWREVDGNYVMAAVATGIIASTIIAASH